jgi:gliding motility-associated lipoprotein GldH
LLVSCDSVYKQSRSFEKNWNYNDSAVFNVDISNTKAAYNVYIDLNNKDSYRYSNLYLFISLKSVDNKSITDTVDVPLADYRGKWYGNEKGDDFEGHYLFKKSIFFPKEGTYTFSIKHGMRDNDITGISSVGVSIEEFKE